MYQHPGLQTTSNLFGSPTSSKQAAGDRLLADCTLAKADRYLDGWQAGLLNAMGRRVVLVNAVLDSQLIYAMCALLVPPGTISQMDQQ